MSRIYYTAGQSRRREIDAFSLDTSDEGDMLETCEKAAEDHYKNHDGLEGKWPITIRLYLDKTGGEVFSAEVEFDCEPVFAATRKTEAGGSIQGEKR